MVRRRIQDDYRQAGHDVMGELLDASGVTLQRIAERLGEMLNAKRARVVGTGKNATVVESPSWGDIDRALLHIARMRGLYAPEKREMSGPGGSPVPVDLGALPDSQRSEVLTALRRVQEALATAPDPDEGS
jgi:hypothetical protein